MCVTTLNIFNQGPWNKSTSPPGLLLHAHIATAQSHPQGPAQKSECLQGLLTWAYPAQGAQSLLQVKTTNMFDVVLVLKIFQCLTPEAWTWKRISDEIMDV